MDVGAPELLIILVIALLLFGANKLPKLARSLGQASREFKAGTMGLDDEPPTQSPAAPAAAPAADPPAETPRPT